MTGTYRRSNPFARLGHWAFTWFLLMAMNAAMTVPTLASPDIWRREGWGRTDFSKRSTEWSEIVSGGPPKDGIPSIDEPRFVPAVEEKQIAADEPVIGLDINREARAYPIRILIWHEIVNDTVGGVPVAVTYCPLCNAAIVFDRRAAGQTLTFGTSGKLRRSDLVMYDRETESWWQQFMGDAIVGTLTGEKLRMIPSRLESFSLFKERNPSGQVLVPNDPSSRAYGRNPYEGYDTSAIPFFYRGTFRKGIDPMVRVVVVREGNAAVAVTLELLRNEKKIEIADYALSWSDGQASALDHATVAGGRDVGNVVAQKSIGGHLADIPYDVTFAFVFHAFHPEGEIIQKCPTKQSKQGSTQVTAANIAQMLRCNSVVSD